MMCCTAAGWLGPALAPPAGLRTVGPLVLDMTAAAAAPETPNTGTDITSVHVKQTKTPANSPSSRKSEVCHF